MMTALHELLADITQLEKELRRFENQFGVRSPDFYRAMIGGDLEEFDALDDYRMTFLEWFALYKTWLSLDTKYRQLVDRQPIAVQIKTNLEMAYA